MAENRSTFTVGTMSGILGVSRSGFYDWLKRRASNRRLRDMELLHEIRRIFRESHETYGCPRIHRELKRSGFNVSGKRVARIMKMAGISPKKPVRRRIVTTDSNHDLPVSPDLLKRDFTADGPNRKWVSDITYIRTLAGWAYLCLVLDLFSRRIVGWSVRSHMKASLVCEAFNMAAASRRPVSGELIFHSDRGSQYASGEFRDVLEKHGVVQSMSRKGECLDNAVAESIIGTIKSELTEHRVYRDPEEARRDVLFYIEGFYNTKRLHSYLDYRSPDEFESLIREVA